MRCGLGTMIVTALTTMAWASVPATAAPQPVGYSTQTLYFSVRTGPDGAQPCTIVGELFVPDSATSHNRAPAVLTTNGFGGSYHDEVPFAQAAATHGYVALAYSGLGFGGSTCKVTLDDPDYDGRAAAQLVSFLGGAEGIAFTDAAATQPFPALDVVTRDSVDHNGAPSVNDPRVGMVGGSYGGGIQFAAASVDARIDTIIPMITWNDLSYSLTPNSTSTTSGVSSAVPGPAKVLYTLGFFATGVTSPRVAGYVSDPARIPGCPNFVLFMCAAFAESTTLGTLDAQVTAHLRHSSVATYIDRIKIPVLLAQGQQDTLFDLNESVATYQALRERGIETKMIWHSWGHRHLTPAPGPAPGEFSFTAPDPATQYETRRVFDWFDHYLKDLGTDTGPRFAYFRDWVDYDGDAEPAYATSAAFPVGAARSFSLSGDGRLVDSPSNAVPGAAVINTAPGGLPTGLEAPNLNPAANVPNVALPGTQAEWTTAPMAAPLDVVGIPTVTLRMQAAGQPVLFVKLYDVAPDGAETLIDGLVAPIRVTDPSVPVPVTLPAIVQRFEVGHSLRLVVAGGDVSFRGGLVPTTVTLFSDGSGPLTLPVVG